MRSAHHPGFYPALALLSGAALAFEITLTRLFSVTQWYHFAFLAVSVALLGYGASGTALTLVPHWTLPPAGRRASILSTLFAIATIVAYLSLNYLPFDSYRIAWERIQILYLVLYYLALTLPFFCAGLVTGLLLSAYPTAAAPIYAANLAGSACGALLPLLLLPLTGEGSVLAISALSLLAAALFAGSRGEATQDRADRGVLEFRSREPRVLDSHYLVPNIVLSALLFFLAFHPPAFFELRLSPYKGLSQVLRFPDAAVTRQGWNAFSRVDRVSSSAIRSAPGLSLGCPVAPPAQDALFVDGDDLSPVLIETDQIAEFTSCLPTALPYRLRPGASALVLGARGGLDVWVAVGQGARSVVAVEGNPLLTASAGSVYEQARVQIVAEEPRAYARRSSERFDVVHLALADTYRPVTSGAFSLGERYDLTVEAFLDYIARLEPDGLLVVERWLQLPPSELLRAGSTAVEAMRRAGIADPAAGLAVLRGWQVGLILVKKTPYTEGELAAIREFAAGHELDLVALPGLEEPDANRLNVLPEPVYYRAFRQLLDEPPGLYRTHPYDVRPPVDDRPFFFHFFRGSQTRSVLEQLGHTWQPWGGSGYFVLVALLAVALVVSLALVLLPLLVVCGTLAGGGATTGDGAPWGRTLAYFGLLGLGFLFVELPLMQRFILYLDRPIYAFAAVATSILLFSGVGSQLSPRLPPRRTLPILAMVILLYPLFLPVLFRALLGLPLAARLGVTVLTLAPLGLMMGTAFPGGLAWLDERAPGLVPWAWAVNGCTSVLAAILSAMIALSAGFSWVVGAGAVAYALAWLSLFADFPIPWYNPPR
ncbi:MAG TPA: hypothetical protein VLC95_04325 [Anaerolineae bacterium]|nr:hypothetical protein [Anaerolineae bacterium]